MSISSCSDDDECIECDTILESLEEIDDEADTFGIDFVKNNDPHAARQYNIYNTPALVYFRRMSPIVFDGDLMDGERILEWLTSQVLIFLSVAKNFWNHFFVQHLSIASLIVRMCLRRKTRLKK